MISLLIVGAAFVCDYEPRVQVGTLDATIPPKLHEASGLVQSRKNPNVFWSHMDSGPNDDRLFALSDTGEYLGVWRIEMGHAAIDPEDIAIGPGTTPGQSYIYFGDVGNNGGVWPTRKPTVYRVLEPNIPIDSEVFFLSPQVLTLSFPDSYKGKRTDIETVMVDPTNGDLYVVTKRGGSVVFLAPFTEASAEIELIRIAKVPGGMVGGDISQDRSLIAMRNYTRAFLWEWHESLTMAEALAKPPCIVDGLSEGQGESLALDINNSGTFYTVSEGNRKVPIYQFKNVNDDGTYCKNTGSISVCFDDTTFENIESITFCVQP